jgi:hypothetical protein
MKFEKRIRALEARLIADDRVVLHFHDGSTQEICGRGDYIVHLFCGACGGADLSAEEAAQLDLIRKSVAVNEPGGGRMIELLRSILEAPVSI